MKSNDSLHDALRASHILTLADYIISTGELACLHITENNYLGRAGLLCASIFNFVSTSARFFIDVACAIADSTRDNIVYACASFLAWCISAGKFVIDIYLNVAHMRGQEDANIAHNQLDHIRVKLSYFYHSITGAQAYSRGIGFSKSTAKQEADISSFLRPPSPI